MCEGTEDALLVPVLLYASEVLVCREQESSRIRAIHLNIFRGLLDIRRMDRVASVLIRELCRVSKRVDESILQWFSYIERRGEIGLLYRCMWESVWKSCSRSATEEVD